MTAQVSGSALLAPTYQVFTIRDPEYDDDTDPAAASTAALTTMIGSSGEEVIIRCAQDTARIRVTAEVHTTQPAAPTGPWTGLPHQELRFASGLLVAVETTGPAYLELELPAGPGHYTLAAHHRGRPEAVEAVAEYFRQFLDHDPDRQVTDIATLAGIEQYLIQIWPTG
ncbi:hypothetical protein AB0M43_27980 [Longispora sp. NPDC051575]|uniref:hypothetical protein n=1 Tax=Longispora sp. NPDC051575 TaxID=3154943 RepID=UPI0034215B70